MKQTKHNTKMHLSQWAQVAATGETWGRTERAAANAASSSLNMSHSATVRLPQLLCVSGHNMTNVTLSLPIQKEKTVFLLRSCPTHFRHIIASLNMSKMWLYASVWNDRHINWHQGCLGSSHLNSKDRVRCKKEAWSFSFQMTAFHANGQREFINLWF